MEGEIEKECFLFSFFLAFFAFGWGDRNIEVMEGNEGGSIEGNDGGRDGGK
jgi:hypothetical protein